VPITYADISKATRLLGYRPETRFKDGVAKMAEWYRSHKSVVTATTVVVNTSA
jgi:UDP-glucuronate 4-epimerase